MANFKQFVAERDAALLSMDKAKIMAYFTRWDEMPPPSDENTFWMAVHMARTGAMSLPMFERAASKRWLLARKLRTMDDGDVLPPLETGELEKYLERCKQFGCE